MSKDDGNTLKRLESALADAGQRIEGLEQALKTVTEVASRHDRDLAHLNLWHSSRIFGHVSRIFPKSRSVIFLSNNFFGDNVKYAFLKFREIAAGKGAECHLLINNAAQRDMLISRGVSCLPEVSRWTAEHIRILLGAKVIVAGDDFTPFSWSPPLPYFLLQGARLIQLWHGIPIKEIGLAYVASPKGRTLKFASTGPADVLVAPGTGLRKDWEQWVAFRDFVPAGYPRNDVFFHEPTEEELLNVDPDMWLDIRAASAAGRKVILYAPTWRDGHGLGWIQHVGMDFFNAWCAQKGYFFFIKVHPIDQVQCEAVMKSMPGIRFAVPQSDIYPLLRHVDVLITDYSSMALDYLLLDRPVVFYRHDHEHYITACRNLLPGHEHFEAGPKVSDIESLCRAVEDGLSSAPDRWAESRRTLRQELFDHHDGNAAERVANLILDQLDRPPHSHPGWAP